tara:strand:- start:2 stop:328 length:327 start_codon:yes stop_codon:yes gene_type:complete
LSKTLHDLGALDLLVGKGMGFKKGFNVVALGLAEEDVARESFFVGRVVVGVRVGRVFVVLVLLGLFFGVGGVGGIVGHQGGDLFLKNFNTLGKKIDVHGHSSSSIHNG